MSIATSTAAIHSAALAFTALVLRWLDSIPYWLLAVPLHLAVATVFWRSAMTHVANWQTTLELFETEDALPFITLIRRLLLGGE